MTTKDRDRNESSTEKEYFDWHKAVPVLAEEVVETEKMVETHPEVENSPKKAILPTGVAAGRVQYVGKVNKTDQYEYDGGKSIMLTSKEKGQSMYMYAYSEEYSDYMSAKGLSTGDVISIVGKISINEEDNFTHVSIENITKSNPRTRANFLTNTAESVLQRVETLSDKSPHNRSKPQGYTESKGDETTINAARAALDTYENNYSDWVETAIRALEKADEIVHSMQH